MTKKKHSLFLVLFMAAVMFLFPAAISADESPLSSNISWHTDGSVLYIEGSGDMVLTHEFLTDIPWYSNRETVDSIVIAEGITSLGENAFADFRKLKSVTFPSSMTTIGAGAFLSCSGLETIALPTRVMQIESGAFLGCEQLVSITIPGSVSYISTDAFYNCYNLTIKGVSGSYAEKFAKENKLPFDNSLAPLSEILVRVDDTILTFDQPPIIVNDRTLVPLRGIFEALGATVQWDASTRTVSATRGETQLSLVVDTNIINKNGTEIEIDVPAQIIGDRTMVPVRAISESLDASVNWDGATRMVLIDS